MCPTSKSNGVPVGFYVKKGKRLFTEETMNIQPSNYNGIMSRMDGRAGASIPTYLRVHLENRPRGM